MDSDSGKKARKYRGIGHEVCENDIVCKSSAMRSLLPHTFIFAFREHFFKFLLGLQNVEKEQLLHFGKDNYICLMQFLFYQD